MSYAAAEPKTPVSVITGFLGSGKTTLLNALLKHPGMAETAVLVNEFGEIGIDHLLIETLDADILLLAAGCLCCTIREDMVASLFHPLSRLPGWPGPDRNSRLVLIVKDLDVDRIAREFGRLVQRNGVS